MFLVINTIDLSETLSNQPRLIHLDRTIYLIVDTEKPFVPPTQFFLLGKLMRLRVPLF